MRHRELAHPLPNPMHCETWQPSQSNKATNQTSLPYKLRPQLLTLSHQPKSKPTIQSTMAISIASLLPISLSLLLLINGVLAQTEREHRTSPTFDSRNRCRIERLSAQEPTRRIESEAGQTELFDERNQQFECVGVSVQRQIIQPRGLLLPSFLNAPRLIYIVKGRGISGTVVPGCPETFQSFQRGEMMRAREGQGQSGRERDQHQRINQFREGDILAVPAGVAHWAYNDGEQPIVAVAVIDVSSSANQLD